MVVAAEARGRGYGDLLLKAALAWARRRGAARILLFSNSSLTPALKLYEKYGFVVTRYGPHPEYQRADIEMHLVLGTAARPGPGRVTVDEALERLPGPGGERFAPVLEHGTLLVEIYAPRGHDPQTPHLRDELYVVVAGRGMFVNGDRREPFGPGDVLFVPAGVVHRFEDFTDDLTVWVVFYGPEGGEAPDAPTR
jgi:mannose-6-phosphate isomerase-like protein (cupin superfamily)